MSGITLSVPSEEVFGQVQETLEGKERYVVVVKKVTTREAVTETQKVISKGVNTIVVRGRQTMEIRYHTNVAVAETIMTTQEPGPLVMRTKDTVERGCPRAGMFGWGDTLCDTTYFNELYHMNLRRYTLRDKNEQRNTVGRAARDGLDVIIDGKATLGGGRQAGIPGVHVASTGGALHLALKSVESLYYMSEAKQHNYAQFSTTLDSSSDGTIKAEVSDKALVMDRVMEQISSCTREEAIGQPVIKLFPGLDEAVVRQVLDGELDNYSTSLAIREQSMVLPVESIMVGKRTDGAVLSCSRLRRLNMKDAGIGAEQYPRGYVVYETFDGIDRSLKGMKKVVGLARLYAQPPNPVLMETISGPELDAVAQGVHNYSMKRNGPFIMTNVAGLAQGEQRQALFGYPDTGKTGQGPGMFEEVSHETLVTQGIDKLTLPNQYQLARVMRTKRLPKSGWLENTQMINTRIVTCTAKNLTELHSNFRFRSGSYFTLKSLRLKIPNPRDRRKDMEYLPDISIRRCMEQYSRYRVMTPGARKTLLDYSWRGSSIQLEAFCEQMILTVGRRTITRDYVKDLLEELCHQDSGIYANDIRSEETPEERENHREDDTESALLKHALQRYNGNRALAAKELGVDTTILWRKLKKYGLDGK